MAFNHSLVWRYGVAVLSVLAATALRFAFGPVVSVYTPYSPLALAVIVTAWFGGRGPGLAATALGALSFDWFFLHPVYSLAISHAAAVFGLALAVLIGSIMSLLIGNLRNSLLARVTSEEALKESENRLESDLNAMTLLQRLGGLLIQEHNVQPIMSEIVDTAIAITGSDFGNIQLVDAQPSNLRMVAQRGFPPWWVDFWRQNSAPRGACMRALERGERVIVEDVEKSPIFARTDDLQMILKAGVRATQSTPLFSRSGRMLGMLCTHYKAPHRPDDRTLRLLDLLARQAADIIARLQDEEALRDSKARLEFVLDAAKLGAWELDLVHHTAWRSAHHDAIFGYPVPQPEWSYEIFLEHVLPEDRDELDHKFREFTSTGADWAWQHEFRIRRADGAVRWLWVQARAHRGEDGRVVRVSGVKQDVTERKEAEEHLRQAQKLESVGLLAGGVAHDFNNLLTVIMGSADSALTKHPESEDIQHVLTASERAAHLTRQLLAYAGKGRLALATFDLSELVSRSTQLLLASIPKRVELVLHPSERELPIKADPSQIEQVLMNLVINAGEAIPPHTGGRVEITTSICEVGPEAARAHAPAFDARAGEFVCLEVTDNGSGMDEATLARMFEPFFSTKFTGRGLGLAAVQGIVRSCGGFIDVHSSSEAGSVIRVFIPLAKTDVEVPAGARTGALRQRGHNHAAILVVDDEEMVRKMACMTLRSEGFKILEAKNGKDALDVLAGATPLPSIVLLDLAIPVMGAEELVPVLKRDYPSLRLIVTSGYPEEEAQGGFARGAVVGFLQKPYTVASLTEKVQEALGGGGPDEETPAAT